MRQYSRKTTKIGTSVLEYTVLFIVIFAGLVAMSKYVQNAMQGQYKKAGETFDFGVHQFEEQGSLQRRF